MPGLYSNETYNNVDDEGDDDVKEDGQDDDNAASGSGYNGMIFHLIAMPQFSGG